MIPSIDDRLASVVRALTDVVLPSLPPEAGLAQEQVQLAIGHLQIMRAQIDAAPAFEADELADARDLAEELAASGTGQALPAGLREGDDPFDPAAVRASRVAIHAMTAEAIGAGQLDPAAAIAVIASEKRRVAKERAWFAPFGFDIAPPSA